MSVLRCSILVRAASALFPMLAVLSNNPCPAAEDANTTYHFSLKKSNDKTLCDAYLQRLNAIEYREPPFCDRPESTAAPGFVRLDRISLSSEERRRLIPEIWNFTYPETYIGQAREQKFFGPIPIRGPVWTYPAPIDIENDGSPDKVIVWRGWGAEAQFATCGLGNGLSNGYAWRSAQLPYIMSADGSKVEAARTISVFGRSAPSSATTGGVEDPRYKPLGRSMSIFEYRDQYYFDAFTYKSLHAWTDLPDADHLLVFTHVHGRTRELCEYEMKDPELDIHRPIINR